MLEYHDTPICFEAWHEAGHALVFAALTGSLPGILTIVRNGRRGGFCGTTALSETSMSPFGKMIYTAAGEAGEDLQLLRLSVPIPKASPAPAPYDPETELPPTVSALAASMVADSNAADAADAEPLRTDRVLLCEVLEGLVRVGRICRRENMVDRWFARAQFAARGILRTRQRDLLKLAQALARYQCLIAIQIKFVLARDAHGWWPIPDPHPLNATSAIPASVTAWMPLAPAVADSGSAAREFSPFDFAAQAATVLTTATPNSKEI